MVITKSLYLSFRKCSYLYFQKQQENLQREDKEKKDLKKRVLDFFFSSAKDAQSSSFSINLLDLKKNSVVKNFPVTFKNLSLNIHTLKKESSGYELIEIVPKATLKKYMFDTIALKFLALANNGISPSKCYIIKLLPNYKKDKEDTFFEQTELIDITQDVLSRLGFVKRDLKKLFALEKEPDKRLKTACFRPYECERFKICWGEIAENSVLTLKGMPIKEKLELIKRGKTDIEELKEESLTPKQFLQKISLKTPHIDKEKIEIFLQNFTTDLFFLDFESHQPIMPLFDGMGTFEPVVFQYSLHTLQDGQLKHYEYLGDVFSEDTREKIAHDLIRLIPKNIKIVVYGAQFEKTILRSLAKAFPELKKDLDILIKNIIDLNTPFKEMYCYFPSMRGKHSLKAVLPSFTKDLYKDLEVANGQELVDEYKEYLYCNEEKERELIKKRLLEYCKTDTLALVEIYKELRSLF